MRKPVILLDMDDVLAEYLPAMVAHYNAMYEDALEIESITMWDFVQLLKPEAQPHFFDLLKPKYLYARLMVKPYAQQVVQNWLNKGYEVFIVTDAPMGSKTSRYFASNPTDEKRRWMQHFFPMIPSSNIIIAAKKWMITGDVLVDDKPETIRRFTALKRGIICFDMPYNRDIDVPYRAKDWYEIEKMMDTLLADMGFSPSMTVL